jgi:hypothetical protein
VANAPCPRWSYFVIISLAVLSGTADAKTVSPDTYVSRLCTTVGDWANTIVAARQHSDAALSGVTSLDAAKNVLMTGVQKLAADTDRAANGVQRAGVPSVLNGKRIASRVLAGMTLVRQAFARQVKEAAAVPTDDVTAFRSAVQNLSSNADPAIKKFQAVFSSVGRLDTSGKLNRATMHSPACIELVNSSATTTT